MKIGIFTDSYLPQLDGVATSVGYAAHALEEKGHEVYVIAPRYPHYKDKRKNIYRLTSIKFVNEPETRWALQLPEKSLLRVLRINFDIIHGHSGGGITFLGLQIARARNIPYVGTYHTLWNKYTHYIFRGKIIRPRMLEVSSRIFGNLCDTLIAPTEGVKKELLSYGVKKPITVLPSGIEVEKYSKNKKGYLRKKTKLPKSTKILLYVGRLGTEKSIDFLFKSFKLILEKQPDTALVLVGDGPEKQNLQKLCKKLKIDKNVYFTGAVKHKDVHTVYADADIFVFSSQTETQGIVILEALASGVPVVAVKDEAFKNVVVNGRNGYLVRKNAGQFAEKVIYLLNNEVLYKNFSEEARNTAERFSADFIAGYLENLYYKLINEKNRKGDKVRATFTNLQQIKSLFIKARNQLKIY